MDVLDHCEHLDGIREVTPSSADSCPACVVLNEPWVHLRVCLTCGHVGCCDNSKNHHASSHYRETGHPIIQSYEPGEIWRYCYPDDALLPPGKVFRRRSKS